MCLRALRKEAPIALIKLGPVRRTTGIVHCSDVFGVLVSRDLAAVVHCGRPEAYDSIAMCVVGSYYGFTHADKMP